MDWIPLVAGVAGLFLSLVALGRASGARAAAEDARREAQRRVSALEEQANAELENQRKLLAKIAAGTPMTAEMIESGQLWQDVDGVAAKKAVDDNADVFILDVRTPMETGGGVVKGANLIPIEEIEGRLEEIPRDGRPILVYCAAGGRSAAVCELLSSQGVDGLMNLEGGFGAWTGETESPTTT